MEDIKEEAKSKLSSKSNKKTTNKQNSNIKQTTQVTQQATQKSKTVKTQPKDKDVKKQVKVIQPKINVEEKNTKPKANVKEKKSEPKKKNTKTEKEVIKKEKKSEEIVENKEPEIDIEKIEQELQEHKNISEEEQKKIKKTIIPNILIGVILTLYYIFIELGFTNIETINYIIDLKVFSGVFLIIAIYLFEKSYRKENGNIAIYGIEMLILSIFNFSLVYIYYAIFSKFQIIVLGFAIIVAIYYSVKSIILYIKKKKQYFFEKSDIKEIISK